MTRTMQIIKTERAVSSQSNKKAVLLCRVISGASYCPQSSFVADTSIKLLDSYIVS